MGTAVLIVLGVSLLAAVWFLLPFALRKASEKRLARLCRDKRAIVMTYDDGPGAMLTPRLLDLLAEQQAVATFFVLGRNAVARPAVVERAMRDRHEIGSHSFDHCNAWKVWPARAARDLAAGIRVVQNLGGDGHLFRPPYGKTTLATLAGCRLRRQVFGWWTIDTRDTRDEDGRRAAGDIIEQLGASGGGVVLMHDFDRDVESPDGMSHDDYVIEMTKRILEFAQENGYRLMRLGDILRSVHS